MRSASRACTIGRVDAETLLIPEADSALVGFARRCGQPDVAVYDYRKLVAHFVAGGMTEEEAEEWISFNIEGAWLGPSTPAILHPVELD